MYHLPQPGQSFARIMAMTIQRLLFFGILVLLSACSIEDFKRAGYDTLHQYQCNEQTEVGEPRCNPNYPSYDEYQDQLSEIPE